jgi:hypothetical protein
VKGRDDVGDERLEGGAGGDVEGEHRRGAR